MRTTLATRVPPRTDPDPAPPPVRPFRPGCSDDFDRLYRISHPKILATLIAVLRHRALAEDCAQETFVRAFQAWPRWRPDAPAEAWLHRIALNVAGSARRRERLRETGEYLRRLGHPRPAPDPAESGRLDLVGALSRLPVKQATVIVLRHLHGYSNREIGVALEVPERTVASRLAAARERLRLDTGWEGGSGYFDTVGRSS